MKISKAEARGTLAEGDGPMTAVRESAGERSPGTVRPPGSLTTTRETKARPGARWRILAHARGGSEVALSSEDQPSIFDELVLWLGNDILHLEQMDNRTWYLGIGDEKRMLRVRRNGTIEIGEVYR